MISTDPRVNFGRPSVGGAETSVIASRFRAGESITELSYDYGLETEKIEAAVRYEFVREMKPGSATPIMRFSKKKSAL